MKVEELEFNSYSDLLDTLKPGGSLYNVQDFYVYRGQAEDWPLIPTVLRKENKHILYSYGFKGNLKENYEFAYRYVELQLLKEFYENANKNGLRLPPVHFNDHDYMVNFSPTNLVKISKTIWLPENLIDIAALAQHYGVLTRLLDWSFDINVALYFAAEKAVRNTLQSTFLDNEKKIIIWMLSTYNLGYEKTLNENFPLKFVIPNYYDNPNISAQKGLLTYWNTDKETSENFLSSKVCLDTLDTLIENTPYDPNKNHPSNDYTAMYKIKLPRYEALTMIKHLTKNNYNAASLFPGYYGAAKKIEEDRMIAEVEEVFENASSAYRSPTAARVGDDPSQEDLDKSTINTLKETQKQTY